MILLLSMPTLAFKPIFLGVVHLGAFKRPTRQTNISNNHPARKQLLHRSQAPACWTTNSTAPLLAVISTSVSHPDGSGLVESVFDQELNASPCTRRLRTPNVKNIVTKMKAQHIFKLSASPREPGWDTIMEVTDKKGSLGYVVLRARAGLRRCRLLGVGVFMAF